MAAQTDTTYRCISDCYDSDSGNTYTLTEFVQMCRECFGDAPVLAERWDGRFLDVSTGEIVLEVAQ